MVVRDGVTNTVREKWKAQTLVRKKTRIHNYGWVLGKMFLRLNEKQRDIDLRVLVGVLIKNKTCLRLRRGWLKLIQILLINSAFQPYTQFENFVIITASLLIQVNCASWAYRLATWTAVLTFSLVKIRASHSSSQPVYVTVGVHQDLLLALFCLESYATWATSRLSMGILLCRWFGHCCCANWSTGKKTWEMEGRTWR